MNEKPVLCLDNFLMTKKLTFIHSKNLSPIKLVRGDATTVSRNNLNFISSNEVVINNVILTGKIGITYLQPAFSTIYEIKTYLSYFNSYYSLIKIFKTKRLQIFVKKKFFKVFLVFLKFFWKTKFKVLVDIVAIDNISRKSRFNLTYTLLSTALNSRTYISVFVNAWEGVASITELFKSANWLEREVWDMNGIFFYGHSDLRRILTDYGFFGHPLKKNFPLTGYYEVRYNHTSRRVIFAKLNFSQELRVYLLNISWKNLK